MNNMCALTLILLPADLYL